MGVPQALPALLVQARLLPEAEAASLYRAWREGGPPNPDGDGAFLRWLVGRGLLTDYQANLLSRGHADGYFLGPYKILDRIGRGRMAGVYKSVHTSGQVVAIKVLPPSRARDPELLARFHREARLILKLNHPNVVRAFQLGEAGGLPYLVMEYLEGETLEEVLRRETRLPATEAGRLTYQLLEGLQYLHTQGLIHRDVKPANLMLVRERAGENGAAPGPTLKILDIGLGRLTDDGTLEEAAPLTTAGSVLGTPDYMAPEQARDARTADIRSDIYSAGCVLYHLLTGQPPFPDTNPLNQMVRHATQPPRPLTEFGIVAAEKLQPVLDGMLAKEPAKRYATPELAARALKILSGAAGGAPPRTESDGPLRSYLEWLSTPSSSETVTVPGLPQSAPPQTPTPAPVPSGPAKAPSAARRRPVSVPTAAEAKSSARRRAVTPPAPPPAPELSPDAFDVELVPADAAAPPADGFEFTRRDFLMMGIGAGGVLLAVVAGWLLAQVFRRKPPPSPAAPPDEPE